MRAEVEEVASTLEHLRARMVDLVVRGLASVAPGDLSGLEVLQAACEKNGMAHVTGRLTLMLRAIAEHSKTAPAALLSAYTSLHVFERVLSLEAAAEAWGQAIAMRDADDADEEPDGEDEDEDVAVATATSAAIAAPSAITSLPAAEQKKLATLLDELAKAIEDLVRTGLTNATQATRQKLDVSFKEASRMKLLRLGASLRYVNEEVGRFLEHDDAFSAKRFVFFTHRSWLLAKGIGEGMREKNDHVLAKLLMTSGREPVPIKSIDVVTLGVFSRTMQNACTFDFRLRVVKADDPSHVGRSLVLGLVFARKSKEISAEAFLHLPQPQKYHPKVFTEPQVLTVTASALALDDRGGGRLLLGPKATVTQGKAPKSWERFLDWKMDPLLERVRGHAPSPLDLPVELQEEVILTDWTCHEAAARATPERRVFTVLSKGLELDAVVPTGPEGKALGEHFESHAKKKKHNAPLYGVVHYEHGRLVMMPLSIVNDDGPVHMMLSNEKINVTALLGSLHL